jgi:hypothetical protein
LVDFLAGLCSDYADWELPMSDIYFAQSAINAILADLEKRTGLLVESLSIEDIDVTEMGDSNQQVIRSAKVKMKSIPGQRWAGFPRGSQK